jgi:plastocyanin
MLRTPGRSPFALAVALASLPVAVLTAAPRPATAGEVGVGIVDFAFSPASLTVDVGDTVVWTNSGAAPHTATSDAGQADSWDSGTLATGQTFAHTFSTPGTFSYFCAIHPFMRGSVTVREVPTPTATPSPSPTSTATPTPSAPASTPEPSPTVTSTPPPRSPTPDATSAAATASPPAPPEHIPPASTGGGALAASTPPRADLPSAGRGTSSRAGNRATSAIVALAAAASLTSLWWSRRRA